MTKQIRIIIFATLSVICANSLAESQTEDKVIDLITRGVILSGEGKQNEAERLLIEAVDSSKKLSNNYEAYRNSLVALSTLYIASYVNVKGI